MQEISAQRRWFATAGTLLAGAFFAGQARAGTSTSTSTSTSTGTGKPNKLVMQVSDNDPGKWGLALNNAHNVLNDLGADNVALEIVVYGPGIGMLKRESSVAPRIAVALMAGIQIVACESTLRALKLGHDDMLPDIGYVPAGVVELMQKQQQGYAYVRP